MSKSRLNAEQKEEAIKMYLSGKSANEISRTLPISPTAIYGLLKRRNVPRRTYSEASRKYSLNETYFQKIENQNQAYFLGFLIADGYNNVARNCVELSSSRKDKGSLEMLNKEIGSNKPVRSVENNGIKSCRIDWCSSKLCKDLERHGCVQAKTFKIKMPKIDKHLIRHFIRGYFDGDGCISYSYTKRSNMFGNGINGVVTIVGTEDLCLYLKKYIKEELDIHTTTLCRNPDTSETIKTLQISGNQQVIRFMDWLYKDCNLYMERKKKKLEDLKEILNKRKEKIEEKRDKEKELLKLSEIVNDENELWKSRYWITRGEITHESRSRFTVDQASLLRDKLDKSKNEDIISSSEIKEIFELYRDNGFPYYNISIEEFKKGYQILLKSTIDKKDGCYYWDGYGTQFATCFHPQIFNCSRKNKMTALELFNNDDLFKAAIKKSIALNKKISDSTIREVCRNDKKSSRVNNFPPRVAMSILNEHYDRPISVLDPCGGFSGRMIGCSASKLVSDYSCIDLSPKTVSGLSMTKKWLREAGDDMRINISHGDCLMLMKNMSGYDCILTSPPFLDVERYDGVPYETDYENWKETFVSPFIDNCFKSLNDGGKLFVYLEKIGTKDFPLHFSEVSIKRGFSLLDPIKFSMAYGENNRSTSSSRCVKILSFQK